MLVIDNISSKLELLLVISIIVEAAAEAFAINSKMAKTFQSGKHTASNQICCTYYSQSQLV